MREYAFELALCAHLEATEGGVVARQVGGGVHDPGGRVLDVVRLAPGEEFDRRAAVTAEAIPPSVLDADVGPGRARPVATLVDGEWDREAVDRAVAAGYLEREYRDGEAHVRAVTRYPEDWFDGVLAVENKPDLSSPGALEAQLRTDVSLALADRVVLATASHVTGAHLNRLPEAVGVWRFDPATGDRTVVREPSPLPVDRPGVEPLDRTPTRTEIRVVDADRKRRARRRLAERAYGKGWRPAFPACARVRDARTVGDGDGTDGHAGDADGSGAVATAGAAGVPYCPWRGRVVDPGEDCGPACGGHDPADPPAVDRAGDRARRTPWRADPEGLRRRQSGLDRFR